MHEQTIDNPICEVAAIVFRIKDHQLYVGLLEQDKLHENQAYKWALATKLADSSKDKTLIDTLHRCLENTLPGPAAQVSKLDFIETRNLNCLAPIDSWTISCPYLVISNHRGLEQDSFDWFTLDRLRDSKSKHLVPSHQLQMINSAFKHLYYRAKYSTEPNAFLRSPFTLSELQKAYETVLQVNLHKKNFRDRIKQSGSIRATDKFKTVKRSKAQLYKHHISNEPYYFSRVIKGALDC